MHMPVVRPRHFRCSYLHDLFHLNTQFCFEDQKFVFGMGDSLLFHKLESE